MQDDAIEHMTLEKLETYERLSAKYMEDAQALLEKGDTVQAGEKLWGSVAEAVKATATKRSVNLRTHADIWNFILRLDREYPRKEFYTLFTIADHLHSNFYEDELPSEAVTKALSKLKELTVKLKEL